MTHTGRRTKSAIADWWSALLENITPELIIWAFVATGLIAIVMMISLSTK